MAINDSAVVPLYQQVKDDIRAAIESGKYKTNEKIPPEPEPSALKCRTKIRKSFPCGESSHPRNSKNPNMPFR